MLCELRRPKPDRNVVSWFVRAPSSELFLSVLVIGEIRCGIERLRRRGTEHAQRAATLDAWLRDLTREYTERVLPVGSEIADAWGRLNAGRLLPVMDGLLIATAGVHGLSLVTREASRFADLGAPTIDPWLAPGR